eukprot:COSAG06_NODE_4036_length_4638_cov_6.313505_2_plen_112_part_00
MTLFLSDGGEGGDGGESPEEEEDSEDEQTPKRNSSPSGAVAVAGEGIEAVLDKLTMMERRQESVVSENNHKLLALVAQYDSLGERLGAIEKSLTLTVSTEQGQEEEEEEEV